MSPAGRQKTRQSRRASPSPSPSPSSRSSSPSDVPAAATTWQRVEDAALRLHGDPSVFVGAGDELAGELSALVKLLFEESQDDGGLDGVPARQLFVRGFDEEQIWEQLQLRNVPVLQVLETRVAQLETRLDDSPSSSPASSPPSSPTSAPSPAPPASPSPASPPAAETEPETAASAEGKGEDELFDMLTTDPGDPSPPASPSQDVSMSPSEDPVKYLERDGFFNMAEFEAFVNEPIFKEEEEDEDDEEREEDSEDEDVEDAYANLLEDPDDFARTATYEDFYEDPAPAPGSASLDADSADEDSGAEPASMAESLAALEQELIQPRSWDLMGEAGATDRPRDSLLETELDFDFAGVPPPPVTEQVTADLEALIKQRIVDDKFDDVVRKVEVDTPGSKRFVPVDELSMEKSQEGLADLYERQYVEQGPGATSKAEERLEKKHHEIAILVADLFHDLDSLTNFQFTPKPAQEELTVVSSAPAIQMEEVIPMGVSEAQGLAPEELYRSQQAGKPTAREEMSREEKQARRRAKRARRRARKKSKFSELKTRAHVDPKAARKLEQISIEKDVRQMNRRRERRQGQAGAAAQAAADAAPAYSRSSQFFAHIQAQEDAKRAKSG